MRAWLLSVGTAAIISSLVFAEVASAQAGDQKAGVAGLLARMDGENLTEAKQAGQAIFALVQKNAGTTDAVPLAEALAGEMGKHGPATRGRLCEMLGYLGSAPASVEALRAGLKDAEVREEARRALTRITDERATAVLLAALDEVDEAFQVAIINGLGEKGDGSAVAALLERTAAADQTVGQAAWRALARIASPNALQAFTSAVQDKKDPYVTELLLDYAEALLDAGNLAEADTVLRLRKEAGPLTIVDQCRFLRAHARIGTPESISLILSGLDETDLKIRGAAFDAAAVLPGTEVTRAITRKMNDAEGQAKLDLLELLGKRGRHLDDRTIMLMYMAMIDKDETVKIACIRAMQEAGVTTTVPTLLNLLRGPAGPLADSAEQALSRTPGEVMTQRIVEALAKAQPPLRARLLDVLANRGDSAALPAAMRFANDGDASVRAAAYRCLGRLGGEEAYDTLLAAFGRESGPDVEAAEQAMRWLRSDLVTAKLLSGYFESSEAQKPSLLRVLARRQLEAIDALLLTEATSPAKAIREAAILGLAFRAPAVAAPTLLKAAKDGPERITAPAVTGYLKIAANIETTDPTAAASMYVEALKLAVDEEQIKSALGGVRRLGDPASPGLISLVEQLMTQGNLKTEAATALAALASRLPQSENARAIELLEKVMNECPSPAAQQLAILHLRELGVALDPARSKGFITCWWLLGPVDRGQDQDWDRLPAPLGEVDLSEPVVLDGSSLSWKKFHSPDPQGAVDLTQAFGELSGKAVYAYAEITVEAAQEAVFKIGSDDGIAVWLNGQTVHANNAARPLVVDQDVVSVPLRAGKNTIIARIQQGSGSWGFCLRIVGADGKPLALQQKTE